MVHYGPLITGPLWSTDHYGPLWSTDQYGPLWSTDHYCPLWSTDHYGPLWSTDHYGPLWSTDHKVNGILHTYDPVNSVHLETSRYGPLITMVHYGPLITMVHYGPLITRSMEYYILTILPTVFTWKHHSMVH